MNVRPSLAANTPEPAEWPEPVSVQPLADDTISYVYYAATVAIDNGANRARIEVSSDVATMSNTHELVLVIDVHGAHTVDDPADYTSKVAEAAAMFARLRPLVDAL